MVNDDCIFCKLANGVFETNTLYEDDDFRVIFDASPATKGHVLILPKEHAANVFELSEETASKVFVLAKKIATVLKKLQDAKELIFCRIMVKLQVRLYFISICI